MTTNIENALNIIDKWEEVSLTRLLQTVKTEDFTKAKVHADNLKNTRDIYNLIGKYKGTNYEVKVPVSSPELSDSSTIE